MLNQSKYIKTIPFSGLFNWSVQYLSETKISFNAAYPLVRIGAFLKRNKTGIEIRDDVRYTRVTIRVRNGGVTIRDTEIGKNIGTKRQFVVSEGQFILSKIDARNGAMGVIPAELEGAIVTQDFLPYDIDAAIINPQYLVLVSTTAEFVAFCQTCSSGTTNRQRIEENKFLDIKIPLPSLAEQNALVAAYNDRIATADSQELQANIFEQQIEKDIFDRLKIKQQKIIESKGLQFSSLVELSVWGVEKLMSHSLNGILSSQIYPNKPLATIVLVNPTTDIKPLADNDVMSFIPMGCISDTYGEWSEKRVGEKLNSKGYTKFQDGDLIWARITPCMQNGKSAIVENLENGFGYGSTEFHVIRSKDSNVSLQYIYTLLRLPSVLKDATKYFTGSAGQQRVPKSYLEMLNIPIPPLKVQNEIVTHISGLKDQIKQLRTDAITNRTTALTDFEQKIFV